MRPDKEDREALRILKRFEAKYIPVTESGCWLWIASCNRDGYGTFGIGQKVFRAHRVSYELVYGQIAEELEIDHLCRVRCCVNPDHLQAIAHRSNVLRGQGLAATFARRTHCKNGHELGGDNVTIWKSSRARRCLACHRQDGRARYLRQTASLVARRYKPRTRSTP